MWDGRPSRPESTTASGSADSLRSARRESHAAGLESTGEGDLGQASRGRNLVAAQEDAVAAIDRGAVTPGGLGQVERAGAAVHHLPAVEGDPVTPPLERLVEQLFKARASGVGA